MAVTVDQELQADSYKLDEVSPTKITFMYSVFLIVFFSTYIRKTLRLHLVQDANFWRHNFALNIPSADMQHPWGNVRVLERSFANQKLQGFTIL